MKNVYKAAFKMNIKLRIVYSQRKCWDRWYGCHRPTHVNIVKKIWKILSGFDRRLLNMIYTFNLFDTCDMKHNTFHIDANLRCDSNLYFKKSGKCLYLEIQKNYDYYGISHTNYMWFPRTTLQTGNMNEIKMIIDCIIIARPLCKCGDVSYPCAALVINSRLIGGFHTLGAHEIFKRWNLIDVIGVLNVGNRAFARTFD